MRARLEFQLWVLVAARFVEKIYHLSSFRFFIPTKAGIHCSENLRRESHLSEDSLGCKNRIHVKQKQGLIGKMPGVFRESQGRSVTCGPRTKSGNLDSVHTLPFILALSVFHIGGFQGCGARCLHLPASPVVASAHPCCSLDGAVPLKTGSKSPGDRA